MLSTKVDGQCGKLITIRATHYHTHCRHLCTRRWACVTASREPACGSGHLVQYFSLLVASSKTKFWNFETFPAEACPKRFL